VAQVVDGRVRLSERPGLGDAPDLAALRDHLVPH
jgi:hypothetical protein